VRRQSRQGTWARLDLYPAIPEGGDGWVVDLVEMHVGRSPGGYLKISHIPSADLGEHYPTPLEWAVRKGGVHLGLAPLLDSPEEGWDRQDIFEALEASDGWQAAGRLTSERHALSDEALRAAWSERRGALEREHAARYESFCAAHVDQPLVDSIQVYAQGYDQPYCGGRRVDLPVSASQRRKGLSFLLYEAGALWMHGRGLCLHASDTQATWAPAAWRSMERRGLVGHEDGRSFIDAAALLGQSPHLAEGIPKP
jgi:hypothetical protein